MLKQITYSIFLFVLYCSGVSAETYDLAATMIFRDEAPYLKEWIEYHKLLGVQHFYLYNNLSEDNYLEVLDPYIRSGEVDLVQWPYDSKSNEKWDIIQRKAYDHSLKRAKKSTRWLAIIDSDEFLVPAKENNLVDFLKSYEKKGVGGVRGYWVFFGTSFVEKIPEEQLLVETLILNGAGHHLSKSIVRPRFVTNCLVHKCNYVKGYHHIQLLLSEMQINHYWSRDEYYLYNYKIPRRKKWNTSDETCILWGTRHNSHTPYSETILRFVEPLRSLMGLPNE